MMGRAFSLVCLALPWSSGTGGTSLRGWVCVRSGRDMPFFAIAPAPSAEFPDDGLHLVSGGGLAGPGYHLGTVLLGQGGKAAHGLLIFGQRHHQSNRDVIHQNHLWGRVPQTRSR